jgi:tungstate transport system substrate-binding protein
MINIKTPQHASYIKTGSGMANTINIAAEMQGYVLTDRGTWIAFTNKNDLTILFEGDSALFNPYGIIAVNPNKFPHVEYEKSQQFINWLLNGKGNELIKAYAIDGQQLFFTYN